MSLIDLINPPQDRQRQQKHELHQWQVKGYSTQPMGNYLKALGLLRMIKEIDPHVRGFWQGDRFFIQSSLKPEEIIDRILSSYEPSGICTPWNGSSGFYRKMPPSMADILQSNCPRWNKLKNAYQISQKLTAPQGLPQELKNKTKKYEFISQVRSAAIEESWHDWLNVVSVPETVTNKNGTTKQEYIYPGITGGTGGIIGNKDMGVCFAEALNCLWNLSTGFAKSNARFLIESSLLGKSEPNSLLKKSLLTQFHPVNDFLLDMSVIEHHREYAKAGSTTGLCNPFDAVLIYEGLLTFSGVSCRIKNTNSEKTQASFSFAVDLAIGTADVAVLAEDEKKAEEIWLPLWNTPLSWNDLREEFFNPNRLRLPNQQITDTIDFAYSLSRWSQNNDINRYLRYAFLKRKGKSSYFAIPVGEFSLKSSKTKDLAAQLRYFRRDCRRISQTEKATHTLKRAIAIVERELILLAAGKGSYLNCLIQIGVLEREISYSSILDDDGNQIRALQPLNPEWLDRALIEDNSSECRLGIALACLNLRNRATKVRVNAKGKYVWVEDAKIDWSKRNLVHNLIHLQRRWQVERIQELNPIPTKLAIPSFADLDNFIRGNVSDSKIEQIALGASICIGVKRKFMGGYVETLPPHYAIGALLGWGKTEFGEEIGGQELMFNALSRGQPKLAMQYGLRRLKGRGMIPYLKHLEFTPNAERIAAAMAFPLSVKQLNKLQNYYLKSAN